MLDHAVTLYLIPRGADPRGTGRAILSVLREAVPGVVARAWIADVDDGSLTDPPFAAIVAGRDKVLAPLLARFFPRAIGSSARIFLDQTTYSSGMRTDGISLLSLIVPYPGVDHEETIRRWREHAPLALAIHHAAKRYVQYEMLDRASEEPCYAGLANLHLPGLEAMKTGLFRTPDDVALIADDVARFVCRHDTFLASEYVFEAAAA